MCYLFDFMQEMELFNKKGSLFCFVCHKGGFIITIQYNLGIVNNFRNTIFVYWEKEKTQGRT